MFTRDHFIKKCFRGFSERSVFKGFWKEVFPSVFRKMCFWGFLERWLQRVSEGVFLMDFIRGSFWWEMSERVFSIVFWTIDLRRIRVPNNLNFLMGKVWKIVSDKLAEVWPWLGKVKRIDDWDCSQFWDRRLGSIDCYNSKSIIFHKKNKILRVLNLQSDFEVLNNIFR